MSRATYISALMLSMLSLSICFGSGGDWQYVLNLLNSKRSDVGKDPVSVSHPEDIDMDGVFTIRAGTEEILLDYGFTGLADALNCAGYAQDTWSEGFDCKNEIIGILNLMYFNELNGLDHLSEDNFIELFIVYKNGYIDNRNYCSKEIGLLDCDCRCWWYYGEHGELVQQDYGYGKTTIHFKSLPSSINILDYHISTFTRRGSAGWCCPPTSDITEQDIISQIPISAWFGGTVTIYPPPGSHYHFNGRQYFPILKYAYHSFNEKVPTASFTYSPENPMVGEEITFDGSSSSDSDGTIVSYEWDFGDGDSAAGQVVTHAYAKRGEYSVTLTVIDNDGLQGVVNQSVTVYSPKVYVLSVGVKIPDEVVAQDIQAGRVRDAFASLPGVTQAELLTLSAANSNNTALLTTALNNAASKLSSEDIFIMYIGGHGFFDGGFDEPNVYAQYDTEHPDWRIYTNEDEHFYFSQINSADNISDDVFSGFFIDAPWPSINKLFIIDTCYAGGFWGDITGLDSGDLGRLTRATLIPAASEPNFAGTYYDPNYSLYLGKLGGALVETLNSLPYEYYTVTFEDLVSVLQEWGNSYRGVTGPILDFTKNWGIPIETDFDVQPQSTADFRFTLQVRMSALQGDLDDDGDVDLSDLAVFTEQWLLPKLAMDVVPSGGDGIVNFLDWAIFADGWQDTTDMSALAVFVDQWLQLSAYCADIAPPPDGDGTVNMLDFAVMAKNWLIDCDQTPGDPACVPKGP